MYEKSLKFAYFNIHNLNYDLAETMDIQGSIDKYVIKVYNKNGNNAEFSEKDLDHIKAKDFITTAAFSHLKEKEIGCKDMFLINFRYDR